MHIYIKQKEFRCENVLSGGWSGMKSGLCFRERRCSKAENELFRHIIVTTIMENNNNSYRKKSR